VNLHGYSRFTGDVDIILALNAENLDRLVAVMDGHGFSQRLPIDVHHLSDRKQVRSWIKTKNLTAYTFVNERLPQFSVDIMTAPSLNFPTYDKHKVVIRAGDLPIPVISIDDLIAMKRSVNRRRDIEDVAALLELKGL
jgi:hypothetical protein